MKTPEIAAPKNFSAPEGTKEDEEFTLPVVLKLKKDGKLCVVAIDGAAYAEEGDKGEKSGASAEQDFEARYQAAMQQEPQQMQ